MFFKRTAYADTFRYIPNFKTKQIRFEDFFYNLDCILCSHICCERIFYIRDFKNEHIALFYLSMFPPQVTSKLSELLYTDNVYSINIDAIPASYDIKYIKELIRLDEQNRQLAKQQLTK